MESSGSGFHRTVHQALDFQEIHPSFTESCNIVAVLKSLVLSLKFLKSNYPVSSLSNCLLHIIRNGTLRIAGDPPKLGLCPSWGIIAQSLTQISAPETSILFN